MRSIPTPHTKTGKTIRDVETVVDGPSMLKELIVVPAGTKCRFIGRWVVADLSWLALKLGKQTLERHPDYGRVSPMTAGVNTITYHDADHYGIGIDADNVAED